MRQKTKKEPSEGGKKSMKELTKNHDQIKKEEKKGGKDAFEELLKKSVKPRKS